MNEPLPRAQRLCAYALLTREDTILLCRLAQSTTAPGKWTLPGGGLEFGEHPEEAARREVLEETGFVVDNLRLKDIWSTVSPAGGTEHHVLHFLYFADIVGGEQTNEVDNSTDLCAWVSFEETRGMPLVTLAERGVGIAFDTLAR